ncbi:OsmC family protein [Ferrimonas balearica]|uniref:OsmC family protein n=1 Tax=Ferrimonas balearica TaxID=44012 RepID=UPI001C59D056|nr:OsmC family protein [Ferrimonas balearica]MBW3163143.1 OsmC family protein [Ferrimonas balearica]MBY6223089.1 OsmC family protein [Ferrimonas balearica]
MADKQYRITSSMTHGWKVTADVRGHKMVIDQPSATDEGANPLETFLFSLAGCLSAIAKMAARDEGITLRGIEIDVTGVLNPAGLAGKPSDDPVGFKSIDATARIDADLSDEEKAAFFGRVCHRCPIHDNLLRPTVVTHSA